MVGALRRDRPEQVARSGNPLPGARRGAHVARDEAALAVDPEVQRELDALAGRLGERAEDVRPVELDDAADERERARAGADRDPARGHSHAALLEPLPNEHEPQPAAEAAAQRAVDRDLDVALASDL